MDIMLTALPQPTPPELASRILIVDDDSEIRSLLGRYLQENGFAVSTARDGQEMQRKMNDAMPDFIILDLMLPGRSGYDLCKDLRQTSKVPILMLTARGEEADRVIGLELGADDYLQKPFSPRELLARIRAILRRSAMEAAPPGAGAPYYTFAGWRLDSGSHTLTSPQQTIIDLSGGEYDVLLALVEHPQRVLSRDQLMDLARHRQAGVFDRSMDVQISRLRRKLTQVGAADDIIKTVRGAGYMLTAPVRKDA